VDGFERVNPQTTIHVKDSLQHIKLLRFHRPSVHRMPGPGGELHRRAGRHGHDHHYELRATFQRPTLDPSASAAEEETPPPDLLSYVPPELISIILSHLDLRDLAYLAATCRSLWCDAPTSPPLPPPGLVETELRQRAAERGLHIGSSLSKTALSPVPYLLKLAFLDVFRRQAPLAVGDSHNLYVDGNGTLLTCGSESGGQLLYAVDPDADPEADREIVSPTRVPSMQGMRIVSVATSGAHCLALSAEGEVYSWGKGEFGSLGQADRGAPAVPSRIETLSHIERVAVGTHTSAAVDEKGRLYTWGKAFERDRFGHAAGPSGLGYALDPGTDCQPSPTRVDALSQERVVGVALGYGFTLAVTDAGAVFSFGDGMNGVLGHGSVVSEVLPRRIKALAETGRRFVAVAAGNYHSLALTEGGEVYWCGYERAIGHGHVEHTPQRVAALAGERVELVYAQGISSCAVTEQGELFTWGASQFGQLGHGHGLLSVQPTPKRVESLSHVKVAAVALGSHRTLVADVDGVVWGLGERSALGLGAADDTLPGGSGGQRTPIPNLRVRGPLNRAVGP